MIVDLSSPSGQSVNDGVKYASVDQAVSIIQHLGRGTQLVKVDIKDAYRIIPVLPSEYHLLGISWEWETFIDRALPFGLRSAPKIFSAFADFLAWVLNHEGFRHLLHYLDDFLLLGSPNSEEGATSLRILLELFRTLHIPVAAHKTEGPACIIEFLGILIDTLAFKLRLPSEKLARLRDLLQHWSEKRSCTRQDLQSLLGHLLHAAMVARQGRTFLCQLFPLLQLDRANHHRIRLNAGARAVEGVPSRLERVFLLSSRRTNDQGCLGWIRLIWLRGIRMDPWR